MEQLTIPDLFFVPPSTPDEPCQKCLAWLTGTHGCIQDAVPYVTRLYDEFNRMQAFDRAKVFPTLCGRHRVDGWGLEDAEHIGVFDHGITDYHVLWDRDWAIKMLVPKELVPKVWKCGYGGRPRFWDRDGNLLFESVYSVDGHALSREERMQSLTKAGG